MNTFGLPSKGEYPPYYERYISQLGSKRFSELIPSQSKQLRGFFSSKPTGWESVPYAPGKWTPKEMVGHLLDTERIMTFRALCIARGEKKSLPGYDQDPYVIQGQFNAVSLEDLLSDFETQREAMLSMVRTLPLASFQEMGTANGNPISTRALLWIIPGHFMHHFQVLQQHYL
ncbi:MAG: DinB family protein [Bacteroidetes bacterium]|nr:DinB family protein [Bacteroidota bacterium]MDA1268752.1 DinB family protein [Bacteroidota bacterium]